MKSEEMTPKQQKEMQIIIDKFFLETQRLVNKLTTKIYEINDRQTKK